MSRPRLLAERFYVPLLADQSAVVRYYAWKYNRDLNDIFRKMITDYARADKRFDVKEFKEFVAKEIAPQYKGDKEMQEELATRIDALLDGKK